MINEDSYQYLVAEHAAKGKVDPIYFRPELGMPFTGYSDSIELDFSKAHRTGISACFNALRRDATHATRAEMRFHVANSPGRRCSPVLAQEIIVQFSQVPNDRVAPFLI
jgi:hypothetical protein